MTDHDNVAVLFADMCGSTELYSRLGDDAAFAEVASTTVRLRDVTARHGGRVVKTIGDAILATFSHPDAAFRAALEMQRSQSERLLQITAAFHVGPVILESDDIFGDTVNVAARLVSLAQAGEVLMSEKAAVSLSADLRGQTRFISTHSVKGKETPLAIHGVLDASATERDETPTTTAADTVLLLAFQGATFSVRPNQPKLSVGRTSQCDLVVDDDKVSRQHAVIECRHGVFYVHDQSTNGTFVVVENEKPQHITRESVRLFSNGGISPGVHPGESQRNMIWFRQGLPGTTV